MTRGALPVLSYASDDHTELNRGTLQTPDDTIDTTIGTIRLKATFLNTRNTLWPGPFINAHLQIGLTHDAVHRSAGGDRARAVWTLRLHREA